MTPPYKAVLFDLDGTLADTAPDLAAALNRIRLDRGLESLPLEQLRPMASHGARGLIQVGFSCGPEHQEFSSLRDEFLRNYAQAICVHTRLFPGIAEVLEDFDSHALPWGIVTNKVSTLTHQLLACLSMPGTPSCVVSGDTAARAKPWPDPLLHAAALLDVQPGDCLYLGDDLRDIQAAHAAGMDAAAAAYGYCGRQEPRQWGARYVLDEPLQLLQLGLV